MSELNIGVLAVQGDVEENVRSTQNALEELELDGKVHPVKTPEQISELDGLIIPGGESTMIGQLSLIFFKEPLINDSCPIIVLSPPGIINPSSSEICSGVFTACTLPLISNSSKAVCVERTFSSTSP